MSIVWLSSHRHYPLGNLMFRPKVMKWPVFRSSEKFMGCLAHFGKKIAWIDKKGPFFGLKATKNQSFCPSIQFILLLLLQKTP